MLHEPAPPHRDLALARILVVDDDADVRELLVAALEQEGYAAAAAPDGSAALERLRAAREAGRPPHAIVLDMKMPFLDGPSFIEAYRREPGPHAPILVLTASPPLAAAARALGVRQALHKPFELADLLLSVAQLVRHTPTPRQEAEGGGSDRAAEPRDDA